jgi:ribulose-phosphate 3-epimerase
MALVAASLLAADFARLAEALDIMKAAGATTVHVDVMDGHLVPDISVGQPVIRSLRKATDLVLDVHLLIERPERYAAEFVGEGADCVSFHVEATNQVERVLGSIYAAGGKAGVALKPSTPLAAVAEVLGEVDQLVVLTAEPGLREKALIPRALAKVQAAFQARAERRLEYLLLVEGGVTQENVEEFVRAGADILVAGSAILHTDDPQASLAGLMRRAAAGPTIRV